MTLKKYLTILKMVYVSLIASLLAFFVFFGKNASSAPPVGLPKYAILAVTFAALGVWAFTGKLLKTDPTIPLHQRMQSWYNYKVIRGAVLETVGMVGVVATIVTYDPIYFLAPIFITGILFTVLPSEKRIQADLRLNEEELAALKELNQ